MICNFKYEMKKFLLIILPLFGMAFISRAQMAFVDTKSILNKMPAYQDSLAKLNAMSVVWQKEIDDKQAVLEKMNKDFERDEPMLSDDLKKKRTDDIFIHQKEVRDLQRMRFGFQGDLTKKRVELLKPLEDRVNAAVQTTAIRLSYVIVLDKSEGITVIFSKSNLDITGEVEKELGLP
jgi:outer membrane protein